MLKTQRIGTVTHQQIGDRMGISRSLVTLALNGTRHSGISQETRLEIQRVAREMNYQPRKRTTYNIGYVLQHGESYLEKEQTFAILMERAAREAGYRLFMLGIRNNEELASISKSFNAKTVDGVISPRWFDGDLYHHLPTNVPTVCVSGEAAISPEVDVVTTDVRGTVRDMTSYLIDHGHLRIGIVMSAGDIQQNRDVISGARGSLRDYKLPGDNLYPVLGGMEEVASQLVGFLDRPDAPTAWLCISPSYATAILFALLNKGKKVPKDVSVMSLFDSPQFMAFPAPLTSTTAMGAELAHLAMARLIENIECPGRSPTHHYQRARIIERSSVATRQPEGFSM